MIAKILIWPDPVLKTVSQPVTAENWNPQLGQDLIDTMVAAEGLGLSAIQIGVALQVLAMHGPQGPQVFVNPRLEFRRGKDSRKEVLEGCLSVPGFSDRVRRHPWVRCHFLDTELKPQVREYEGLWAQCLQHECEHLRGRIFLENLVRGGKDRYLRFQRSQK